MPRRRSPAVVSSSFWRTGPYPFMAARLASGSEYSWARLWDGCLAVLGAIGRMRALLALQRIGRVSQMPAPGRASGASRSGGAFETTRYSPGEYPGASSLPALSPAMRFKGARRQRWISMHVCLSGNFIGLLDGVRPRCGAHVAGPIGYPTVALAGRGALTFWV